MVQLSARSLMNKLKCWNSNSNLITNKTLDVNEVILEFVSSKEKTFFLYYSLCLVEEKNSWFFLAVGLNSRKNSIAPKFC